MTTGGAPRRVRVAPTATPHLRLCPSGPLPQACSTAATAAARGLGGGHGCSTSFGRTEVHTSDGRVLGLGDLGGVKPREDHGRRGLADLSPHGWSNHVPLPSRSRSSAASCGPSPRRSTEDGRDDGAAGQKRAVEYRTLGASGCAVSTLALGTMTFGSETDEAGSHTQLDAFVAAGGTLVDTADVYTAGTSEEIIGRWLASRPVEVRDSVVLATKGRFPMGPGPNDVGLSRRHLQRAVDASLRRLGVDCVDLYQVHAWDPLTPVEETLRTLDDLVRAGKIRYVGLSNYTGWQVQKAVAVAAAQGLEVPVTLQPQYNLLVREVEWEIVPSCLDAGLGLLPWSPLGGGWLTGKYRRDERPTGATRLGEDPDRGVEAYDRRSVQQRTWDVVEAVQRVAEGRGVSPAQVALAWLADRPSVTSVILGARNGKQLSDNLGAADLHLDAEETAALDAASDPAPTDWPYGVPGVEQRSRRVEGGR
jgi:aryl-alcohol dehydrogenase-like predicted oxidoreductase